MLLAELLAEKIHWSVIELISAIEEIQKALKKTNVDPEIKIKSDELVFEVPAGEDIAPTLKQHLKPFIIKVMYDRDGDTHKYHYYITRQLLGAEQTRLKRALNLS